MDKLKAWLKQPTTVTGIAAFVSAVVVVVAHVITKDVTIDAAAAAVAYSLMHLIMPDNSGAASSVEKLVQDAANAVIQKKLAATMPALLADTVAVIQSSQPVAPVAVVVPAAPVVSPGVVAVAPVAA